MGQTGYCVSDDHLHCPDSLSDMYCCDCPCHLQLAENAEHRGTGDPEGP